MVCLCQRTHKDPLWQRSDGDSRFGRGTDRNMAALGSGVGTQVSALWPPRVSCPSTHCALTKTATLMIFLSFTGVTHAVTMWIGAIIEASQDKFIDESPSYTALLPVFKFRLSCRNFLEPQLHNYELWLFLLQYEDESLASFNYILTYITYSLEVSYRGAEQHTAPLIQPSMCEFQQGKLKLMLLKIQQGFLLDLIWVQLSVCPQLKCWWIHTEGAALVFSSKGECDSHPLAGSAPGRPLWATMTRRVDEDLYHSLMNLWCRKWKQPLARSSGARGAAAAVEMGEKLGLKQKPLKTL